MQIDAARRTDLVLAQICYFAGLDGTARREIERAVRRRSYEAGERILTQDEPCQGLHFVISGQVRLVRTAADGREQVLSVLGPGATFNDAAVFEGRQNSDGAVAVGATTVGLVPTGVMTSLIDRHPEVAKAALKVLSARQRALAKVIEDLALHDVTTRVARLLLGCIGRHEHMIEKADTACMHITHQEIASMVGSVREVVQRALKELERDGAITLERSPIRVRDPAKLERRATG